MDEEIIESEKIDETDIEEEKPSLIKKIIIIAIGLFLLLLLLSYFLLGPSNISKLVGFLQSSTLNNSTIIIDNSTILIFNNESLKTLYELYDQNLDREFKVCLKGTKFNNTYFIEETIQPKTFVQRFNMVIAEQCSQEDLVHLHTHPFKQCLASDVDIANFKKFKAKNDDALMAIMCDKDRFNFYR